MGGLVLMVWSTLFCGIFFKILSSIGRFRVSHVYEVIGIDLLMHQSIDELKHHPIVQSANFEKDEKRTYKRDQMSYINTNDILNCKKDGDLKRLEKEQKISIIRRLTNNKKPTAEQEYNALDKQFLNFS